MSRTIVLVEIFYFLVIFRYAKNLQIILFHSIANKFRKKFHFGIFKIFSGLDESQFRVPFSRMVAILFLEGGCSCQNSSDTSNCSFGSLFDIFQFQKPTKQ